MKLPVETIRISKQGKDQLSKLRKQTGIENWNILCRWAFCVSLKEPSLPTEFSQKMEGGVEITWKVFAGEYSDIYASLIWLRARNDGFPLTSEGVANCLRTHLHRGLSYLASGNESKTLSFMVSKWLEIKT